MPRKRTLTIREILACADAYHQATGNWPTHTSGSASPYENWHAIDNALRQGTRGLPGGSSLARLLSEHRGVRNHLQLPPLTEEQIVAWADTHHERTGCWPHGKSGNILVAPGETWSAVDCALNLGRRGLPGGSSLARLLAEKRGVRNRKALPSYTEEQILAWSDAHFQRTGCWPQAKSGAIQEAPGETWLAVDKALAQGGRGLPGGSALAFLLAEKRDVRNRWTLPRLTIEQILAWADAYFMRTGGWPDRAAGTIPESGDTWLAIDTALAKGVRGLPGGLSLAQVLAFERGVRSRVNLPHLRASSILAWADAFHRRTGTWPTRHSGPIPESSGDTWLRIDL